MQSPTNNNNKPTIVVIVVSNLQNGINCGGDGVTLLERNQPYINNLGMKCTKCTFSTKDDTKMSLSWLHPKQICV